MTPRPDRTGRSHADYRLLAAAAVDGRIAPDDAAALDAHLATCDSCRADQEAMIADHAWLASPARVAPPRPRVRATVLDAARSRRVPRIEPAGLPWTASVAATALVVLVGGAAALALLERSPGPGASVAPSLSPASSTGSICGPAMYEVAQRVPTGGAGTQPTSVALGDFDGGHGADAVIGFADGGGIGLALGDDRGGFNQPRFVAAPGAANVGVVDLDGDEISDVVATSPATNRVYMLFGDGSAGLGEPISLDVGVGPQWGQTRDFDEDGDLDLAIPNNGSDDVTVLLGDGKRHFTIGGTYPAGPSPWSASAGDFNDDAHVDLVISQWSDDRTAILLGDGAGGFETPSLLVTWPAGRVIYQSLDAAGLNGLLLVQPPGAVSVLRGDGRGGFGPEERTIVDGNPVWMDLADVDRNGARDILAVSPTNNRVLVLLSDGDGHFVVVAIDTMGNPEGIAALDLDSDGWPDFVTANRLDDSLTIFHNRCGG
jgi:VCBS repeat protein/putative zinc finger protein